MPFTETTTEQDALAKYLPVPLTADDVTAFKMADSVSLHLNDHAGSVLRLYVDGAGTPAIFTVRQQQLFPDSDYFRTRDIRVGVRASGYGQLGDPSWSWSPKQEGPVPACFLTFYARAERHTIARAVRVGDVLSLTWTADNNTEILRDAGLHQDDVHLEARDPKDRNRRSWLISRAVSRDNSARMIRRNG